MLEEIDFDAVLAVGLIGFGYGTAFGIFLTALLAVFLCFGVAIALMIIILCGAAGAYSVIAVSDLLT
jgi:hypothetical protein